MLEVRKIRKKENVKLFITKFSNSQDSETLEKGLLLLEESKLLK